MREFFVDVADLKAQCAMLRAGNRVFLTGTIYTARDAAHKKIFEMLGGGGKSLPFDIKSSVVYYAGATPTPKSLPIGACGPTTSSRMDSFAPTMYDFGMVASIGKGPRNGEVVSAIVRNRAVYLCAVGGAGALAASCVKACEEIAYQELGCESVKKLDIVDFPLVVGIDLTGGNLFV